MQTPAGKNIVFHHLNDLLKGIEDTLEPQDLAQIFEAIDADPTITEGHVVISMQGIGLVDPAKLDEFKQLMAEREERKRASRSTFGGFLSRLMSGEEVCDECPVTDCDRRTAPYKGATA